MHARLQASPDIRFTRTFREALQHALTCPLLDYPFPAISRASFVITLTIVSILAISRAMRLAAYRRHIFGRTPSHYYYGHVLRFDCQWFVTVPGAHSHES